MHLPVIIQDLAIILIVAGLTTLFFRAIRQPVVLGYIVAGFFVGPHFQWLPTVVDVEGIKAWSELGIIFLLFTLGLEFSFKKLARVGAPATITALFEVVGMVAIGFLTGLGFGWSQMDCLYLGGILAISSTTIIIRTFDELGLKTRAFAGLVFGILIVEDLFAVLVMFVLSTLAVQESFSGMEMLLSVLKLAFFLTLWFVLGIFLIPSFLKRTRKFLHPETLLIVSIGLCFLMVVLATHAGFSAALGAFITGSLLAETAEGERIEHLIQPVKDLFGAVFFVSVGMLIDPQLLSKFLVPILVISAVTIFGKFITTTSGAMLSGRNLRQSVHAGMSLAQIGEFSFIIAGLGLSLKVTSDFLYPIAISVSAVTAFTTPYLIRSADRFATILEALLPTSWHKSVKHRQEKSASFLQANESRNFFRESILMLTANGVVVIAVFLIVAHFLGPWIENTIADAKISYAVNLLVAFTCSSPFLWALAFRKSQVSQERPGQSKSILAAFAILRCLLVLTLCAILSLQIGSAGSAVACTFGLAALLIVTFLPYFKKIYFWMETRFVSNLHHEEAPQGSRLPQLAPWDAHLAELKMSADSLLIGQKLSEAMIREKFGVTIAMIKRGQRVIAAPDRNERLYPADTLQVIGTDEQIGQFKLECEATGADHQNILNSDHELQAVLIRVESPYAHKTIRECGLRERIHGLVVGIEKGGQRILNPDSFVVIEPGDLLWLVGNPRLLREMATAE